MFVISLTKTVTYIPVLSHRSVYPHWYIDSSKHQASLLSLYFIFSTPFRIVILHDPLRESSKTADSWVSLASKLASLTISSLGLAVTKYEDRVRTERERRNDKSWNFCSYFILQVRGISIPCIVRMCTTYKQFIMQCQCAITTNGSV